MFSRTSLMEQVWNYDYIGDARTVDVTVRRLREKIETDPANPVYILTRRGVGYFSRANTEQYINLIPVSFYLLRTVVHLCCEACI